jgi:hypothetical protein
VATAGRRHRRRCVGKTQADQACFGRHAQVIDQHTGVVAVDHADHADAERLRTPHCFSHGQIAGRKRQAGAGVDHRGRALALRDPWHRRPVDPPMPQMPAVLRHPAEAMRGHALRFGQHQRARRRVGHRRACAGALQRHADAFAGLRQ